MLLDETEFLRLWKRYKRMKTQDRVLALYDLLFPTIKYTFRHYIQKSYYNDLFQEMYMALPSMLDNWSPEKGRAYNYFHTSFSNRGRTYAKKERNINSKGKNPLVDPSILEDTVDDGPTVDEILHMTGIREVLLRIEPRIDKKIFWFCLDRLEYPSQKIIQDLVKTYRLSTKTARFCLEYSKITGRLALQNSGLVDDLPVSYESLLRNQKESVLPEMYLILGHELFIDLMRVFGGTSVSLPTIEQLHKQDREDKIAEELRAGVLRSTLEKKYGVNSYYINKCIRSMKRKPR